MCCKPLKNLSTILLQIPCEPMIAPCLFNIEQDPCEMVNLAGKSPLNLIIFETILIKHGLTVIPPSNLDGDPRSDPSLWNNTWTSWTETNPLMLAYTNIKQPEDVNQAMTVISIIFCVFLIGAIIVFKYQKINLNNLGNPEH